MTKIVKRVEVATQGTLPGAKPPTRSDGGPAEAVDQFAQAGPSHYQTGTKTTAAGAVKGALVLGATPPVRMSSTLSLDKLRDLDLTTGPSPGRAAHLSAASGLVKLGDYLLISPDDENHLGIFTAGTNEPGTLLRLFPGDLPTDHDARKAAKPDLEALAFLDSAVCGFTHGAVLAIGSGSTDQRQRAALVPVGADGRPTDEVTVIDLSPLYRALAKALGELNIEGAAVSGDKLRLLQRGNGAEGVNAVIDLDLAGVGKALSRGRPLTDLLITSTCVVELGEAAGVPLTFTDATPLPDGRIVFTASAEASENTYEDGEVAGSAVGILDPEGRVVRVHPLAETVKVEGVDATLADNGDIDLLLVTDGDDAARPGELFATRLPARRSDA